MSVYLGLDVGGTKTEVGLVTAEGEVRQRVRCATGDLRRLGDPLSALIEMGRKLLREARANQLDGVGIALPGPVDPGGIRMLAAPTIPEFAGIALAPDLESAFGCLVAGENDANACALAESRFGAGLGCADLVYFTVSTGIGGGAVVGGEIFRGAGGTATEFGHQIILPEGGPKCDCGSHGCLEALASGRGIAVRARAAGLSDSSADLVADLARQGDPVARAVWRETALYLGIGIANVINIVDPQMVVLGGGVILGAEDLLLEPVRQVVGRRCMPSLQRGTPIAIAGLGADLGVVSAACLVIPA